MVLEDNKLYNIYFGENFDSAKLIEEKVDKRKVYSTAANYARKIDHFGMYREIGTKENHLVIDYGSWATFLFVLEA